MTNVLITPVVMLTILGAILNPFKNTEVAAEEKNKSSIEYKAECKAELYPKRQERAADADVFGNKQVELSNEDGNSEGIAASRKRRSSNVIDGYIDEFKRLDEQYCNSNFPPTCESYEKSNEDASFLPSYESFLNRIREYALTAQNKNDKMVLGYLYTATLGRIYNLEDHLEATLVDNITSYFDSVRYDIEKLKDLQNKEAKKEIINKYKQKYKYIINKKIEHAKDLVSVEILPEIEYLKTEIDDEIENLINEVIELENENGKYNDDLRNKRRTLRKAVLVQGFLGPLKVLGEALSLISRAEEVAGSAIEFGSSLAETSILDIPRTRNKIPNSEQIVVDLNSLKDEISKFSDQKVNRFKKTLEIISEEIDKYPSILAALSVKLSDIRNRTDAVVKNRVNIKEVQGLEIELIRILQTERNETIEDRKGANDRNVKTASEIIDNVLKSVQVSSATVDVLYKYKESPRKLVKIRKIVQHNEQKNYLLKEYENQIYAKMVLSLENIKNDLDDMIRNIDNEEKVIFDVTEWNVKYTLNNLMVQHENITVGFRVQGELKIYITKLKDAMFTLLRTQEYIEDFEKLKTLANFINNIDTYNRPKLEEDRSDALRDLEITIRSNIVIQRYKVAIDTFKQVVFPFAHTYLGRPIFPSFLELYMNKPDSIIHRAAHHFQEIKRQLALEKVMITRIDECKVTARFSTTSDFVKPFFTWKKELNRYMFSRLLSGKEVIVKADITKSHLFYNAIKFLDVEFYFKTKKSDAQRKLNEILKNYQIYATYLGDSYYRYKNKIYLMTPAANFSIMYTFQKDKDGVPVSRKSLSYKYRHENPILSPYAAWKIKLGKAEDNSSFTDLEIFMQRHKLEFSLGGSFRYVMLMGACTDLQEDTYYNAVNY